LWPELSPAAQDELVAALCRSESPGTGFSEPRLLETHISYVLLLGAFAYKIKKAVDLGFVNFATLEARRFYCTEEVRLNRRFAPNLYLGVVPITGSLSSPRASDTVNVFDISMGQNKIALLYLLNLGVKVNYFDHHFIGTLARHANLTAVTDTALDTCTSALVDRYVGGQHRAWAVVGAFGDNLEFLARRLAEPLQLSSEKLNRLQELGRCMNYNAYGETVDDLYFHPAKLYGMLKSYGDPLRFVEQRANIIDKLREGRTDDLLRARETAPQVAAANGTIYVLPDTAWSRRVRGEFANVLASTHNARAHAVLSRNGNGGYAVSVRAPLTNPRGADELCFSFESGGGRPMAAGINDLPEQRFSEFSSRFLSHYS
jgi:hypothetical protein